MSKLIDRTGEEFITEEGYEIVIIKYNNAQDVLVKFKDKNKAIVHTKYCHCRSGKVKNPYHPSVYGVGYIGIGKYKAYDNNKQTETYIDWTSILNRGFDEKVKKKHPTYKDVTVNQECYCFQDFAKWREQNYYEIEGEQMCLDKDILYKGNKEYSFNTMVYVPQRINKLFVKCDATRGKYPIGVSYRKDKNSYETHCSTLEGRKFLGYYNTPDEAFQAYKEFKEAYIKEVADEYKGRIPDKLYDAMYRWEVEIDD